MQNTPILLADDDTVLSDLLKTFFEQEGFSVVQVYDGQSAVEFAQKNSFALIILDVMMPVMNGFDALRALRQFDQTPVIMLTARGEDIDRIVGLEMGADDYLPKPCNPRELVARVRAVLRRTQNPQAQSDDSEPSPLSSGGLHLNELNRTVTLSDEPLELTSTEFNVLSVLLKNAGSIVNKEQLSELALGRKLSLYDRSLDMHISNLRKKLGRHEDGSSRIKTVRGVGYLYTVID